MAADQFSLFSAGLPGLTFGIGLGQGLPVQYNADAQKNLKDDVHEEETEILAKNSLLPSGILAVRLFGCEGLVCNGFDSDAEIHVYAQIMVGSCMKNTQPIFLANARPVWDETKFFPVVPHPLPQSRINDIAISIIAYDKAQETFLTPAKHRLIGIIKCHVHKVIKNITSCEALDILDRKQQSLGKLELEFGFSYGSMGYGLSHQLENSIHTPAEMVKHCLFPKLEPYHDSPQFRGMPILPARSEHPDIVPFDEKVVDLEPEISDAFGYPYAKAESFPLVKQNMERMPQLCAHVRRLGSRAKRVAYIRSVLQDKDPQLSLEQDASDDEEQGESQAPIPSALAVMMTSSLLANAPGVTRRSVGPVPMLHEEPSTSSTIEEQDETESD